MLSSILTMISYVQYNGLGFIDKDNLFTLVFFFCCYIVEKKKENTILHIEYKHSDIGLTFTKMC